MTDPLDETRLIAMRFENDLEATVKGYDPNEYASIASCKMRLALAKRIRMSRWRPHDLIHSIEACCAFHRRGRSDPITPKSFVRILNVYYNYADQYVMHLLSEERKLAMAFRVMAAQQFPFQYQPHYHDFARVYAIFVKDDPLPKTTNWMRDRFGITPLSWLALSFSVMALVQDREPPVFATSHLTTFDKWSVTQDEITSFIALSTRTASEIRDQYREERVQLQKAYLRRLIQSGFIDRPLMTLDETTFLVPLDGLLFRNAGSGLLRLCREHDPVFGKEIGASFERYVRSVLDIDDRYERVIDSTAIESVSPGRSCDFIVEFDDYLLLVECKAVSMSVRIMTEETLRCDNSTTKIVGAISQLVATVSSIREDSFSGFGAWKDKAILGAVVTYGDVFMVNSPWYRKEILGPKLREHDIGEGELCSAFDLPPQVLSTADFEKFVLAASKHKGGVRGLFASKEKEDYLRVGDWDQYLNTLLHGTPLHMIKPADTAMTAFFEEVLGKSIVEQWRCEDRTS